MASMDANAVFADGIQELSFDEIEAVDGGRGIGSLSSDAVGGIGAALVIGAATAGAPLWIAAAGGALIYWAISKK